MRNRTMGINVRVSENEKKKLQRNAKKSSLNLSSYLRKAGLQEVRKMERYSNEIRLIVSEKLKTTVDVKNYIIRTEKEEG